MCRPQSWVRWWHQDGRYRQVRHQVVWCDADGTQCTAPCSYPVYCIRALVDALAAGPIPWKTWCGRDVVRNCKLFGYKKICSLDLWHQRIKLEIRAIVSYKLTNLNAFFNIYIESIDFKPKLNKIWVFNKTINIILKSILCLCIRSQDKSTINELIWHSGALEEVCCCTPFR